MRAILVGAWAVLIAATAYSIARDVLNRRWKQEDPSWQPSVVTQKFVGYNERAAVDGYNRSRTRTARGRPIPQPTHLRRVK